MVPVFRQTVSRSRSDYWQWCYISVSFWMMPEWLNTDICFFDSDTVRFVRIQHGTSLIDLLLCINEEPYVRISDDNRQIQNLIRLFVNMRAWWFSIMQLEVSYLWWQLVSSARHVSTSLLQRDSHGQRCRQGQSADFKWFHTYSYFFSRLPLL